MLMARATLIADSNITEEVSALETWLERSRESLTFASDQQGCGCCILMFDVEGPSEIIASIPANLLAQSEWSKGRG